MEKSKWRKFKDFWIEVFVLAGITLIICEGVPALWKLVTG